MSCLHKKVILISVELGTGDFIVHHIHAFTIHIALLICMKGILYARKSRFISLKLELGWIYPCDVEVVHAKYQPMTSILDL
jgi:photosystem I P700 chlorophyll a apoprotein A1